MADDTELEQRRSLPELKARGKTVIVVTHDDRYFHLGDKVFKLDYGRTANTVAVLTEGVNTPAA